MNLPGSGVCFQRLALSPAWLAAMPRKPSKQPPVELPAACWRQANWAGIKANMPYAPPGHLRRQPPPAQKFLSSCVCQEMARGLDTGQGEAAVVAAVADIGSGNCVLHLAATEGRMDVCKYLVEDLRLDVNQPNDRGGGWEEDTDPADRVHGEEHSEVHEGAVEPPPQRAIEYQWGAPNNFWMQRRLRFSRKRQRKL